MVGVTGIPSMLVAVGSAFKILAANVRGVSAEARWKMLFPTA